MSAGANASGSSIHIAPGIVALSAMCIVMMSGAFTGMREEGTIRVILTVICLCAAACCYYLGLTDPGRRGRGTTTRWVLSLAIGGLLALVFYSFSAFGLIVSLDNLFSDF